MPKVRKYPVKKKHYRMFKAHFRRLVKVVGVSDWEIRFTHQKLGHKRERIFGKPERSESFEMREAALDLSR